MNTDERKRLRAHYHALRVHQDFARSRVEKRLVIGPPELQQVLAELRDLEASFPSLVPGRQGVDFGGPDYYRSEAVHAYLARCIARIEAELDDEGRPPVTEHRAFSFISDPDLRGIAERDYAEIQRAHVASCWKSVIILSGSLIEAILIDQVLTREAEARKTRAAPQGSIEAWGLAALIRVAVELGIVGAGVERLSHSIREYRNLVHPGNELRNRLAFGQEEARIAIEVIHIVHRDLL